ncbi:hypothetical protein CONPUDRAFT_152806 [Coniophora puteana RWD-64-598 SS2]|uniref:Uncharacterized protein n=1 Tax=Coniophora puteana (strain RWD-64-598) TaxID=741705 RepID=A0A5M3MS61_CONPW|nr:uncharacterized protein CONPUDRAFT_152806 [Coniophora puteana RWD-64-598 SS2]EIW81907.1 hypothetical protein CONPUDRAFT_152806 [Coniophora puteana RWD-64-598 SS2]
MALRAPVPLYPSQLPPPLHSSSLAALTQRKWNVPATVLPRTLLIAIFKDYLDWAFEQRSSRSPRPDSAQLMSVITHVCRQWRYTAIYTPALWRNVSLRWSYDMVEAVLLRSAAGNVGILVETGPSHVHWDRSAAPRSNGARISDRRYTLLGWHMPRVLELRYLTRCTNVNCQVLGDLLRNAASLVFLTCNPPRGPTGDLSVIRLPPHFPRTVLYLNLIGCNTLWNGIPVNLHMLHFSSRQSTGDLPTLLGVLGVLPYLQVLTLKCALPSVDDTSLTDLPLVDLPRLRELCLLDTVERCNAFVSCINVPAHAKVLVSVRQIPSDLPTNATPAEVLRSFMPILETYWRAWSAAQNTRPRPCLSMRPSFVKLWNTQGRPVFTPSLRVQWGPPTTFIPWTETILATHTDVPHLQFCVDIPLPFYNPEFRTAVIFELLGELEQDSFGYKDIPDLVEHMSLSIAPKT